MKLVKEDITNRKTKLLFIAPENINERGKYQFLPKC